LKYTNPSPAPAGFFYGKIVDAEFPLQVAGCKLQDLQGEDK